MDLEDIEYVRANLKFRGAQGTTGTQVTLHTLWAWKFMRRSPLTLALGFVYGSLQRRHCQNRQAQ